MTEREERGGEGRVGEHPEWTDLLSEYMDGTLDPPRALAVEGHLSGCPACARALRELEDVVVRARRLGDRPLERDLWPGVRARVLAEAEESGERRGARPAASVSGPRLARRRVSLTLGQLAAAAVLVTLLAGSAAWALRPLGSAAAGPDLVARAADVAPGPFELAVDAAVSRADLEGLERTLENGRDLLSPHTVRILEKNLDLIDRAISEAAEALAVDPENPFLEEHLRRAQLQRVEYLREATALLEAAD